MRVRPAPLVALVLAIASCSTGFSKRSASETTVPGLESIKRIDTLDHIVYCGSDAEWHYFHHSQLFGGGSYKIARSVLVFPGEFPIDDEVDARAGFVDGFFEPNPDGTFVYESYEQHLARTGTR